MQISINYRGNNLLLENGKLDEQIITDLENYIKDRKNYQMNHLDTKVKGVSHHYEEWTKNNQEVIRYAERIIECMKRK